MLKYNVIYNKTDCDFKSYRSLTESVWADPSAGLVEKWVHLADFIIEARDEANNLRAFFMASRIDDNIIYVITTMIDKDIQNSGIASLMLRKFLVHHIRSTKLIGRTYLVFRTANPSLYEKVYKKFVTFPDYRRDRGPTDRETGIFDTIVKKLKVESKLDRRNFVVFEANKNYPALTYDVDSIPWATNNKINKYIDGLLGLSARKGNALVVVCSFGIVKKIAILLRGDS